MFDSVPSNLPVEPASSGPAPVPPAVPSNLSSPSAPAVMAPPASVAPTPPPDASPLGGKKEPEDIFSGLEQTMATSSGVASSSMEVATSRSFPLKPILIGAVVLVILAGTSLAVWTFVLKPSSTDELADASKANTPVVEQIEQPPVIDESSVPVVEAPAGIPLPTPEPVAIDGASDTLPADGAVTTSNEEVTQPPILEASKVIQEGQDTDADGLTDIEEQIYATDILIADSDGDGYSDGAELVSVFSPRLKAKALVTDNTIRQESWNSWFFLLPKAWEVGPIANGFALSAAGLSRISLEVQRNTDRLSLSAWLGATQTQDMTSFKTKNGLDAMRTADGLLTYIAFDDIVLVVTYHTNEEPTMEYRATYTMFINSLIPPPKT